MDILVISFYSHKYRSVTIKFFTANPVNAEENEVDDEEIVELGNKENTPQAKPSTSYKVDSAIDFNTPFITWVYTDHNQKCEFVCVAIPVLAGSTDINFTLSEDGTSVTVFYIWPSPLFKPMDLFGDKIKDVNDPMSLDSPKLYALKSHLLECGLTEKSRPQGKMVIKLPIKVQRESGTWSKCGIVHQESKVILLEFKAFQKAPVINDEDTSINF